ncbi:MAG: dihydrofolate reductase [Clostridiales Family XIII bacterium]|jgi:lactate dehydrogenase-like 2-hydroxyacid dehydrogenase|nr:dihydrofolate reductase [Clostridiales Family XIII bacterium]
MEKFQRIVAVDDTGIEEFVREELRSLCGDLRMFSDDPEDEDAIIARAEGADALLVSWRTRISARVMDALPRLRYVGMCCSLYSEASANVDIAAARERGIGVRGVAGYGDPGVPEFIFSELIRLFQGFGGQRFCGEPIELTGIRLGIVGLGTTGTLTARIGEAFGMDVCWHGRHPRGDAPWPYAPLAEMLARCDVVSAHLPRNTVVLGEEELAAFGPDGRRVLVNTGLSPCYEKAAFRRWIEADGHFAILDGCAVPPEEQAYYRSHPRILVSGRGGSSGFTRNARARLAAKAVENLRAELASP